MENINAKVSKSFLKEIEVRARFTDNKDTDIKTWVSELYDYCKQMAIK